MSQKENFIVSSGPHIKSGESLEKIMWTVVAALIPSGVWGVYVFGMRALWIILISVVTSVIFEALILRLRHKKITVQDGSAVITGLLLSYNFPVTVPYWIPAVGAFFAIVIAKQLFGGLGYNIFNPALIGRVFLMASWPTYMTTWVKPVPLELRVGISGVDMVTTATPLAIVKHKIAVDLPNYFQLFIGYRAGCIGEVCIVGLLLGAGFLLLRKCITWHIPLAFIFTNALLSFLFLGNGFLKGDALFYTMAGGVVLGAFFMATDMVTSPLSGKGMIIFGVGCGVLTFMIRKWGGYPEGVSYAILMMNAAAPIIDRFTKPKKFGAPKGGAL